MSKYRFNPNPEEFIEKYKELKSSINMGLFYNVNHKTICSFAKRIGYKNDLRKDISWCPNNDDEFIQKYSEFKNAELMAKFYGVCEPTILKYAKKIGYINVYRNTLSDEETQYVLDNYNESTAKNLAKELNVSKSMITKTWRESNLSGKIARRYYINENYFENIDTIDKAYFLGVIASDGCVSSRKNNSNKLKTLSFIFHIQEKDIIDSFLNFTNAEYKPSIYNNKIDLQINSDKIVNDLKKYNITERKTWTYEPYPLSNELMWHYIRGYFDGDGSIYKSGGDNPSNWVVSICGNAKTMKYLYDFLDKNNVKSHLRQDNRIDKYSDDFYYLTIKKNSEKVKLFNYLYNNSEGIRLGRKYDKFVEFVDLYNSRL